MSTSPVHQKSIMCHPPLLETMQISYGIRHELLISKANCTNLIIWGENTKHASRSRPITIFVLGGSIQLDRRSIGMVDGTSAHIWDPCGNITVCWENTLAVDIVPALCAEVAVCECGPGWQITASWQSDEAATRLHCLGACVDHRWSPQDPASLPIPFRPKTAGLHTVGGPNLNNRPSGDSRVDKRQSKDRTLWGSRCIVADRRGRESYLGTWAGVGSTVAESRIGHFEIRLYWWPTAARGRGLHGRPPPAGLPPPLTPRPPRLDQLPSHHLTRPSLHASLATPLFFSRGTLKT